MSILIPGKNDVIIDQNLFVSLQCLPVKNEDQLPISAISDIARLIEAFVFYDRILIFFAPKKLIGDDVYCLTTQPIALRTLNNLAVSEGVLCYLNKPDNDLASEVDEIIEQAKLLGVELYDNINDFSSSFESKYGFFQMEMSRLLRVPFIPSEGKLEIPIYIDLCHQERISIARLFVDKLNKKAIEDIDLLKDIGVPIKFYIPPLLSIVLEKVIKGADFGTAVFDVRNDFKKIRSLIAEYGSLLNDKSITINSALKIRNKIFRDIEFISKAFETRDRSKIKEWADILDIIPGTIKTASLGQIPKASIITKLMKLPIEELRSLILKRRYSSLFRVQKDFYKIQNYTHLLQKAFSQFFLIWKKETGRDRHLFKFTE